ncbi:metal ABC transporter permease [Agrococcus sp. SGAir0287]|uniref:metal ABC transporter permease n=1 Tax=Agrococcus sp. SGAir0287 TaxID=2070347 RepID=UPI0010CD59AA|nr:metal ABC transporter permease [Agrococcus sp. SGAir0287]QCR20469.1 manganese transporter [Agrococcus sp. SGAir0287]
MLDLVTPFQLPFMLRPLVLLLVLAVAAGTVGTIVNLRRLEFASDGLTHAVFPGLVIGFVVAGAGGILPGALVAAIVAALVLVAVARRTGTETGVAIVLTACFSLGVVLVSLRSEWAGQMESFFFGSLLTVTDAQLAISVGLVALAVAGIVATWRWQVLRAFDEQAARIAGVPVRGTDVVANVAVALVVVAASAAVGTLLVLAVLIVPAAASRALTRRVVPGALVATGIAALASWLGMAIAFAASSGGVQASPSSIVALTMLAAYLVALAVGAVREGALARRAIA